MIFNSIEFTIFLPTVFILYWHVFNRNLKVQNFFLVIASYIFYGWWDYRFLSLIILSSSVDFLIGYRLGNNSNLRTRKILLWISVFVNLGILGIFKYYNFFAESFASAFSMFGKNFEISQLNVILPVGISFYTFQTLSYTIDVYRRKLEPEKDLISFFAFVSFFPQLVAGPIERAINLLPQFHVKRRFVYLNAVDGMRQILWGLFQKIVIADNCASFANQIFNNHSQYSGSTLFLGAMFFTFQIYGDFCGYSNIAIGSAKLFGFNLKQNFATPYFSRDIAEFWRRWHISLSSWFKDYLYIPLGGSRGSTIKKIRNTFIIFLVSGFWHGANWTFIVWGLINAIYFLPLLLRKTNRRNIGIVAGQRGIPTVYEILQISFTFFLTVIAWIFFRAENLTHAFEYFLGIFNRSLFAFPYFENASLSLPLFFLIPLMLIIEWFNRNENHGLGRFGFSWPPIIRRAFYFALIFSLFWFGGKQNDFIYFQF